MSFIRKLVVAVVVAILVVVALWLTFGSSPDPCDPSPAIPRVDEPGPECDPGGFMVR